MATPTMALACMVVSSGAQQKELICAKRQKVSVKTKVDFMNFFIERCLNQNVNKSSKESNRKSPCFFTLLICYFFLILNNPQISIQPRL